MLVLSRKTNESICIGPNIYITVLAIKGGRVQLGVDAPREVLVLRGELQETHFSGERGNSSHGNCEAVA
jgi:carbon storage regulator